MISVLIKFISFIVSMHSFNVLAEHRVEDIIFVLDHFIQLIRSRKHAKSPLISLLTGDEKTQRYFKFLKELALLITLIECC